MPLIKGKEFNMAWQFIKHLFGTNADTEDIPLTPDISIPNRVNYSDGIPIICSQAKTEGGLPPRRAGFNALFKTTMQNLFEIQSGQYPTFDENMTVSPNNGYAKGAILYYPAGECFVKSSKDNNADNFLIDDQYIGASWLIIDGSLKDLTAESALSLSDLLLTSKTAADGLNKKTTLQDVLNAISLLSDLTSADIAANDAFLMSDASANTSKKITYEQLQLALQNQFGGNVATFSSGQSLTLAAGTFYKASGTVTAFTVANSGLVSNTPVHIQFKTGSSFTLTMTPSSYNRCTPTPSFAANTYYEMSLLNGVWAFSQGV
jgi:hypothetical protein